MSTEGWPSSRTLDTAPIQRSRVSRVRVHASASGGVKVHPHRSALEWMLDQY